MMSVTDADTMLATSALPEKCAPEPPAAPLSKEEAEPEGTKLQAFADEVNRVHRRTVEAIIELGRTLLAIKAQVGHGAFGRLFAGHAASVPRPIQFGLRTGERLMEIAKSPALAEYDIVSHLPATGIKVLGRLATLTAEGLRRGITEGWVHSGASLCSVNEAIHKMTPAEAKAEPKPEPAKEPECRAPDWRLHLGPDTVDLDSSEQISLLVIQAGGLRPSKDIKRLDIPLVFQRRDGTPWDLLVRDVAWAQGRDERDVLEKIIKGLNDRHAIWQAQHQLGAAESADLEEQIADAGVTESEPCRQQETVVLAGRRAKVKRAIETLRANRELVDVSAVPPEYHDIVGWYPDTKPAFEAFVAAIRWAHDDLTDALAKIGMEI